MDDTKTTLETARSPIDGTESVRLATAGANWKATIAAIFGTTTGVTDQITVVGTLTAGAIPRTLLTGLGTGVATALGVNIGSAGAPVLFNGAGGTPSSLTLTNATGLPPAGVVGTAAILGANTFTGAQVVSGASFSLSGNISAAAWTTSGIRYKNVAATLTDTTSSGTVATDTYTDVWGGNTIAATSATVFTNYYGSYFKVPVVGTNVTFTNGWALGADSALINGAFKITGLFTSTASAVNTGIIASTGYSITSGSANMVDLAGTWNTSGTPSGIKLNITNTASNANSPLLNLAVGGLSKLYVLATGGVQFTGSQGFAMINGTDASVTNNFDYVSFAYAANIAILESGKVGSGTSRELRFIVDAASPISFYTSNTARGEFTGAGNWNLVNALSFTAGSALGTENTYLISPSAAVIQHGAADVASGAVAQIVRAQSNTGASTTGPDFTWQGTKGLTVGGSLVLQTALTTTYATALKLTPAQAVLAVSPTGGLGYGTGAGGAVTQATNKSTGVTLNTVTGQITMNNANLAGQTEVSFTLTNSAIAATDVVLVSIASGATTNSYVVSVGATAAGSCVIQLGNVTLATTLGEAVVLNFAVIKGVTS